MVVKSLRMLAASSDPGDRVIGILALGPLPDMEATGALVPYRLLHDSLHNNLHLFYLLSPGACKFLSAVCLVQIDVRTHSPSLSSSNC